MLQSEILSIAREYYITAFNVWYEDHDMSYQGTGGLSASFKKVRIADILDFCNLFTYLVTLLYTCDIIQINFVFRLAVTKQTKEDCTDSINRHHIFEI